MRLSKEQLRDVEAYITYENRNKPKYENFMDMLDHSETYGAKIEEMERKRVKLQ